MRVPVDASKVINGIMIDNTAHRSHEQKEGAQSNDNKLRAKAGGGGQNNLMLPHLQKFVIINSDIEETVINKRIN